MNQNSSIQRAFQMPTPMSISGRSSSITAAFVSAIIPRIDPSDEEIQSALNILGMSPDRVKCAYCGAETSEWDHLRPLVKYQKPTGFISEIRNLVPSCGKCNQSKGNKYWKDWMTSDAKYSPKRRQLPGLQARIERLQKYENWGSLKAINLQSLVSPDLWEQHWMNWRAILKAMADAQSHSVKLRNAIEASTRTIFKT